MTITLLLAAVVLLGSSGVPGLLAPKKSDRAQIVACMVALAGGALGLAGVGVYCWTGNAELDLAWFVPLGSLSIRIDALGATFLLPIFLVPMACSLYGLGYWKQSEHPENGRKLRLFYGLLSGSMALVVLAHDTVLFLFAWEVMALSAFFLVSTEDRKPAACRAGWIYLVATHVGTLCLFALFVLMHRVTGTFALAPIAAARLAPAAATGIFVLALCGFGLKAGIMPLHVWLPGAHANAPSHVSAVLSGVLLKVGVYGFLRTTSLLPDFPAWWGGALLALGAVSGVAGMAFALGQRDLKRALAYSSIENIGIVFMGIGLALLGRSAGHPEWVALGLAGALLHVWNHSAFKPLLFCCAGSVAHATHTRDIERLGGLSKRMPLTALLFAFGAVAICALPPLNGFVSEWLIYQGLFATAAAGTSATWSGIAFAAPVLAMIGALAVAGFVRLFGTVFLGEPRTHDSQSASESPPTMIVPMVVLAAGCLGLALAAPWIAPLLDRVVFEWNPPDAAANVRVAEIVPLDMLAGITAVSIGLFAAGLLASHAWARRRPIATAGTWDCGYARPTPRMQYTGSSFAQFVVRLFAFVTWPRARRPELDGLAPRVTGFRSSAPDLILDRLLLPVLRRSGRGSTWFRLLQQGRIQIYLLYVPVIVLILLWIA